MVHPVNTYINTYNVQYILEISTIYNIFLKYLQYTIYFRNIYKIQYILDFRSMSTRIIYNLDIALYNLYSIDISTLYNICPRLKGVVQWS